MVKDNLNIDLLETFLELSDVNSVFRLISRWEYIILGKLIISANGKNGSERKIYLEDVKNELNIPMSKVSEIVQSMNDDGYVSWNLDSVNKKTYIQVTSCGREKWMMQCEGMKKIRDRLEQELTQDEKEKFYSALIKFSDIIKEEKKTTEAYFDIILGNTSDKMNIIGLLKPKSTTYYLYDNYSFKKAVSVFKESGFTTLPVINSTGVYLGTISEGDMFWHLYDNDILSEMDNAYISNIINTKRNPAVSNMADSKMIINNIMKQNFLCMVDSRNCFIGIITRKDIINYFRKKSENN